MTYREIFFPDSSIKEVIKYHFNPQPDITAYELSLLLPLIIDKDERYKSIEELEDRLRKMPPEIMRHIKTTTE